jgi:XapX domain-containing protein
MKAYLFSLGAGLLVGIIYSLLGVRSPAPPVIALVGLAGILLGEQLLPVAKSLFERRDVVAFVTTDCARHVLGQLPANTDRDA